MKIKLYKWLAQTLYDAQFYGAGHFMYERAKDAFLIRAGWTTIGVILYKNSKYPKPNYYRNKALRLSGWKYDL